jgi:hypothetical protein
MSTLDAHRSGAIPMSLGLMAHASKSLPSTEPGCFAVRSSLRHCLSCGARPWVAGARRSRVTAMSWPNSLAAASADDSDNFDRGFTDKSQAPPTHFSALPACYKLATMPRSQPAITNSPQPPSGLTPGDPEHKAAATVLLKRSGPLPIEKLASAIDELGGAVELLRLLAIRQLPPYFTSQASLFNMEPAMVDRALASVRHFQLHHRSRGGLACGLLTLPAGGSPGRHQPGAALLCSCIQPRGVAGSQRVQRRSAGPFLSP